MTHPLLPIAGPAPEGVAAMLAECQARGQADGSVYLYCAANRVFTVVILEGGQVVHWQCEPAADKAASEALQVRYQMAARARAEAQIEHVTQNFPQEFRAILDRAVATVLGRHTEH